MTNDLMDIPDPNTMSNLGTEMSEVDHTFESPIAQSSIEMAEESRDGSEIAISHSVASDDEITYAADSGVDETEDDSDELDGNQAESDGEEIQDHDEVFVGLVSAQANEYCILCRARFFPFYFINQPNFHRYREWLSENPEEKWQSEIRAVLSLHWNDDRNPVMTDVVTLDTQPVNVSLVGRPKSRKIILDIRPDLDADIDTFAYCFHDWCYSIFRWKTKHSSAKFLYQMARNLRISTAWANPAEWNGPLYPQIDCDNLLSTIEDTSARFQPLLISKLPLELRSQIWSYVGSNAAYSAFMLVTGETTRWTQHISQPTTQEFSIEPDYYIIASSINIYGTKYIRGLTRHATSSTGIRISQRVTDIDIVSSVHGICSIRFSGSGWTSRWLGVIPTTSRVWYGTIRLTTDILVCFHNVGFPDCYFQYKYLRPQGLCIENLADAYKSHRIRVMWDQPHHPPATFDADAALFSLYEPEQLYQRWLPELRFFRFISLTDRGEYISGLTMYFLSHFIVGLELQFSTRSHFVGSQGEIAVYVPLAPGERIKDVWLRLQEGLPVQSTPSVLICTTSGREHTFGPYVGPDNYDMYVWVLLQHTGSISGFYYENSPEIIRLGIIGDNRKVPNGESPLPRNETCEPTPPLPRNETCEPTPPHIGFLGRDLFLNDAIIHNLKTVTMCRMGSRCVGILIHYLDQGVSPVVLGQWYGPKVSEHTSIYDYTKNSSSAIAFKTSKSRTVVEDIFFSDRDAPELEAKSSLDIEFQVYNIGTRVAWWFSGRHDSIRLWEDRHDPSPSIPAERAWVQNFD
ncbi:hypothetical protein NHQ30_009808 [Ciborinia camelliae]|nr:hypothetical protein NHQ30_009808 [Ciborinia camelliae]